MSEGTWNVIGSALPTAAAASAMASEQDALPAAFTFATGYRQVGLLLGFASVGLVATGLFLLSQMASTPTVAVQLCAVGLLLVGTGLAFLHQAVGRLFGVLIIDENGISQSAGLEGFSMPWKKIDRWEVRDMTFPLKGLPMVRFWSDDNTKLYNVPARSLSQEDLLAIRRLLRTHAPHAEVRLGYPYDALTRGSRHS